MQHPRSAIYDDSGITMSGTRSAGSRSAYRPICFVRIERNQLVRNSLIPSTEENASPAVSRRRTKFRDLLQTRVSRDKRENPSATVSVNRGDQLTALLFLPELADRKS